RLYTDICADVGLGRWLLKGRELPALSKPLSKLYARRLPENIRSKTVTFSPPAIRFALRQLFLHLGSKVELQKIQTQWAYELGDAMARYGFGEATHVYGMLGETPPLMVAAKKRGLSVIIESYLCPSS